MANVFQGARGPADTHQQGEYMSDHSSDDSHYQSEDDEGHDHQAVAVGAPFLALETSDRSSVASSSYSDISAPSKMVVLPIGRTLAKNLTQHDRYVFLETSVPFRPLNRTFNHLIGMRDMYYSSLLARERIC